MYSKLVKYKLPWFFILLTVAGLSAQSYAPAASHPTVNPALPSPDGPTPLIIHTATMMINYQSNAPSPQELERVELWYAQGVDGAWQLYAYDEDKISPISFTAPAEGLYRLFVMIVDRWGRCSYPNLDPALGYPSRLPQTVAAQILLFVDYTKPRLFLYSPRPETTITLGSPLNIQWAGFDTNLDSLPVTLLYQVYGTEQWLPISLEPQKASGDFSWTLPESLTKPIMVKAVMVDRAYNSDEQVSAWIQVTAPQAQETAISSSQVSMSAENQAASAYAAVLPAAADGITLPVVTETMANPRSAASALPEEVQEDTRRQFALGNLHAQRQEWNEAIQAYGQALAYDPSHHDARVQLGYAYYNTGQYDLAQQQFDLALIAYPDSNSALFGSAQSGFARGQYPLARQSLEKLVIQAPTDWYAWILLGDVAEKQGDWVTAQSSWQQAGEGAAGTSPQVVRLVTERLQRVRP